MENLKYEKTLQEINITIHELTKLNHSLKEKLTAKTREYELTRELLEKMNNEWRESFDAIESPMMLHDANGVILRCNKAYSMISDKAFKEIIGTPYWQNFPKRDGIMNSCIQAMNSENKELLEETEEFSTPDNRTYLSHGFCTNDKQGRYQFSIHLFEDISARCIASKALRESEERFRTLFELAPLGYQSLNSAGIIIEVNHAWLELLNYRREEVIGQHFSRFLTEKSKKFFKKVFPMFKKRGTQHNTIFHMQPRQGDIKIISCEGQIAYTNEGLFQQTHCILADITEREQLFASIKEQQKLFQTTINAIPDIICIKDSSGHWLYANNYALKLFQLENVDYKNKTDSDLAPYSNFYREFFLACEDADEIAWKKAKISQGDEIIPQPDESDKVFEVTRVPLFNQDGSRHALVVAGRDITLRRWSKHRLENLNRILKTISECNMALVHTQDEPSLIQQVCDILVSSGEYPFVWMGYATDDVDIRVVPYLYAGALSQEILDISTHWQDELGLCPGRQAARTGSIHVIDLSKKENGYETYRKKFGKFSFKSAAAFPLKSNNQMIGALVVYSNNADTFVEQDINLLEELSNDLAYGISTLRLRLEKDIISQKLSDTLLKTVESIAHTLEKRDPYTAGHQNRVALLALAIARKMGFDDDRLEGLRLGSIIHDIGKIHVPAEILNHPGQLSDLEYSLIKTHSEVGYDIVKEINFPWPVAQMVYQHHERLDGSGYPRGLMSDDIILEAKIMMVADV
ncbi:MAG: PAS domain S-box protein, partial [Gammaproteobacteria bacterium]|nr:PAS domain S-box protein [Gammaproteobacteria bacterium]